MGSPWLIVILQHHVKVRLVCSFGVIALFRTAIDQHPGCKQLTERILGGSIWRQPTNMRYSVSQTLQPIQQNKVHFRIQWSRFALRNCPVLTAFKKNFGGLWQLFVEQYFSIWWSETPAKVHWLSFSVAQIFFLKYGIFVEELWEKFHNTRKNLFSFSCCFLFIKFVTSTGSPLWCLMMGGFWWWGCCSHRSSTANEMFLQHF